MTPALETASVIGNPESGDWQTHDGQRDPRLHRHTPVEVRFRDGDTASGVVFDWDQNWQWAQTEAGREAPGAIVAWRLQPSFKAKLDEETRCFNETMAKTSPRVVLASVRRMMPRNKKPNWSLAMDVYCVGSTYGHRICTEAGIDPDARTLTAYDLPTAKA